MENYVGEDGGPARLVNPRTLKAALGPLWSETRPSTLSFEGPQFQLESLGGMEGGLLNPRLSLSNLLVLDLSNNSLVEIDSVVRASNGFKRLKTLKAANNNISTCNNLDIPSLLELDLSNNKLEDIPRLDGVQNLEVLNLNHNEIEGETHIYPMFALRCDSLRRRP